MEKHYFKVRKLIGYAGKDEMVGIVVPVALSYEPGYVKRDLYYRTDFYTLEGEYYKRVNLERFMDSKTVRITDSNLKQEIDKFVAEAKKVFNLQKKFVLKELEVLEMQELVNSSERSLQGSIQTLVSNQGFLSKDDFLNQFKVKSVFGYECGFKYKGLNITGLTLEKEYDLGKYLDESSYDFITVEYDDNVDIDDEFMVSESKDFRNIKSTKFKSLKESSVDGNKISEYFYGAGGGDKRSASIHHVIELTLKKPVSRKMENMPLLRGLKNAFKDNLV